MCDQPRLIKNTNWKLGNKYKDCENRYIYIPCGHCKSCIATRQMAVVQRMQMEQKNNYLFFVTLTYNNDSLPYIRTSTGYKIAYADNQDFVKMVKRLRIHNSLTRPFRHYTVTELGSKGGRPHLHSIFMLPKYPEDNETFTPYQLEEILYREILLEWRRNNGTRFEPDWQNLCTFQQKWVFGKLKSTYDCHYIRNEETENGVADAAFYVIKYMLKKSDRETRLQQALKLNLPEEEYNEIWKKIKSRHFESENFGQLFEYEYNELGKIIGKHIRPETEIYLRKGIQNTNYTDYPVYFNQETGKTFPLARYYRSRILKEEDAEFYYRHRKNQKVKTTLQQTQIPEKCKVETNENKMQSYNREIETSDITTLLNF